MFGHFFTRENWQSRIRPDGTLVDFEGKSFLNSLRLNLSVRSLSLIVFESAEPAPSPAPVLLVNLSGIAGTLVIKTRDSGRKGMAQAKVARVDATAHSLLAQNIPELMVNWYFPVHDVGSAMNSLQRRMISQERLLIAGTMVQATRGSTEANVFLPTALHAKCRASRDAWFPIFVLRRNFLASVVRSSDVAAQLRDAPLIESPAQYWDALHR